MKTTKVGEVRQLTNFAINFLKTDESTARMKVEDEFFPECDKFVHFHMNDYKDEVVDRDDFDDEEDYENNRNEMAELVVAFLNHHKTQECYLIGPDY